MPDRAHPVLERLLRWWSRPEARLTGWALVGLGIAIRDRGRLIAGPSIALVVVGLVVSRWWLWRTDPVEAEARADPLARRRTAGRRFAEIVAGALCVGALGSAVGGQEVLATLLGALLAVWGFGSAARVGRGAPWHS